MLLRFVMVSVQLLVLWVVVWLVLKPRATPRGQLSDLIHQLQQRWKARRPLRAKTPEACALCASESTVVVPPVRSVPVPYRETKSRGGRKKTISSEGYACLNPACAYFLVSTESLHALVSDGKRGKQHDIQRWHCQACNHSTSARRGTSLFRLKTAAAIVRIGLHLLCVGLPCQTVANILGVDDATVALWVKRGGDYAARQHSRYCQQQRPAIVQMDELIGWLRGALHKVWIWVALDPTTKLILTLHVGGRKSQDAQTFVHQLKHSLADDHLPVFLSDGLALYFYALTAHFGAWRVDPSTLTWVWRVAPTLLYAQVIKITHWRRLLAAFPRVVCGTLPQTRQALKDAGFSGLIQTAFVERVNLTLRQAIAPLTRRCAATYRSSQPLIQHLELFRAYYHFVRPHASLSHAHRPCTPAMAAGWTDHVWTLDEWLTRPLYET